MKIKALLAATLLTACATQEAPPPAPAPAPTPAPAPAATPAPAPAPAPVAQPAPPPKKPATVNIASTELFEFNKAVLTRETRTLLDKEVIGRLRDLASIGSINVGGHADRLGTDQYNQKLSERRADAVSAYLVSKGVDRKSIRTSGFGKTQPVKTCADQARKELIACLAPNRRVVVEIQGTAR